MLHLLKSAGQVLGRGAVQLLFPGTCWMCSRLLEETETNFCNTCRSELTSDPHVTCPRCASSVGPNLDLSDGCPRCRDTRYHFDEAIRLGPYQGLLRDAILRMKDWKGEGLAEMMGRLWAEHAGPFFRARRPDVVIPVPLHWMRRWSRGYNQSQTLASFLAKGLHIPCQPGWVRRSRWTSTQTPLTGEARRKNLRGAFRAPRRLNLAGQTVLLVDDVLTTGTTASEAAHALRSAGPARIIVAVLAHGD